MKTKTFQISPGDHQLVTLDGNHRVTLLLNKVTYEVWVSDSDEPTLNNSALLRASDCPVSFVHRGNLTLWVSSQLRATIGVSMVFEPLDEKNQETSGEEDKRLKFPVAQRPAMFRLAR